MTMNPTQTEIKQPSLLKFERILCPVDFSEFSVKTYAYAQSLARHYRATLFLTHVVQPLTSAYPYYAFPDAWNRTSWDLGAHAEEQLQKLAQAQRWDGIQPNIIIQCGFVPEAILGFAETHSVDLIVMGSHGRQGLDRLTLGSVTEKILRKARCPVLVVRQPLHDFTVDAKGQDPVRLQKVLYCTDFSPHSERALHYALSLAMEYGAEITLLHVLEEIPSSTDLESAVSRAIQQLQEQVPSEANRWCFLRSTVRLGKPYQEIAQLALEAQSDLVVMGVRGRGALGLGLFGSTTHRIIQLGPCPVLAVHV
jgi:nucleotide-binding universal stress UspA family protein